MLQINTAMSRDINRFHLLTAEEEQAMTTEYFRTKTLEMRNRIVNHNLRLVAKIAMGFSTKSPDLFNEGVFGLIKGVERFEPARGLKLSTYVSTWIKAYMYNFVMKDANLVRIGRSAEERKLFYRLRKEKSRLESQGIEVTPELLAENLSVRESSVVEMDSRLGSDTSLNEMIFEKNSRLDMLVADDDPHQSLDEAQTDFQTKKMFDQFRLTLNEKERIVFDLRMLQDERLSEVGTRLDVCKERVRQIENKLTDRLKKFWNNRVVCLDLR